MAPRHGRHGLAGIRARSPPRVAAQGTPRVRGRPSREGGRGHDGHRPEARGNEVQDVVEPGRHATQIPEVAVPVADHRVRRVHDPVGPCGGEPDAEPAEPADDEAARGREPAIGEISRQATRRRPKRRAAESSSSVRRLTRCRPSSRRAPSRSPATRCPRTSSTAPNRRRSENVHLSSQASPASARTAGSAISTRSASSASAMATAADPDHDERALDQQGRR